MNVVYITRCVFDCGCKNKKNGLINISLSHKNIAWMEDANSRPLYEESIKATDSTAAAFQQPNNNPPTDLFKEDSESSDQAVLPSDNQLALDLIYRG